jgi:hypothetical protein
VRVVLAYFQYQPKVAEPAFERLFMSQFTAAIWKAKPGFDEEPARLFENYPAAAVGETWRDQ